MSCSDTIYNSPTPLLVNIVLFGFSSSELSLKVLKCIYYGEGLVLLRPVTGSDTIYNSPRPPLVDIVRFDPLRIAVSLTILKRVY